MDYNSTAVCVRNATKSYGKKPVLENLNMHVQKGIIYGLLGASGCGKTTLLSCIVGRKTFDSGTVWVLGGPPGTSESGIPGPRVGYMPQEVALVAEFTVKAAIYYFGRIFFMSDREIEERFNYLTNLLDLPPPDRLITNCSGGQQRRVSFAAALVSNPELLILDEPTVGLDPVLREKIWGYLVEITQKHTSSVIITTHYIEETRQAHKIGLMRSGRLLAEESPENLLNRFGTQSLEDVFLVLSKQQSDGMLVETVIDRVTDSNMIDMHSLSSTEVMTDLNHSQEILTPKIKAKSSKKANTANAFSLNGHRLKALFGKSWLQITRNRSGIGFMILFPVFEILAFFLAIGDDVKNVRIATLNHEDNFGTCGNYRKNMSAIPYDDNSCTFHRLGCRFLQFLNHPMIDPVFYDDISKAHAAIQHGDVAGVIYISENFTSAFQEKLIDGQSGNATLNNSQIQVWLDMSNYQIGPVVRSKLVAIIIDFQRSLFSDCKFFSRVADIPVKFDTPVYGHLDDTFLIFMAPAVLLTIIYFLGTSNAASIIITDRLEGIWDRSIVAGVSSMEILFSHFVSQFILMSIQAVLLLIVAFAVYKTEYIGSFITISIILILQGVAGIAFGFLVSVVSNSHSMSNIVATGSFYPMLVLCGMMWPLEGMPVVLQWLSLSLPFTLPIISMRNVIIKGWGILHKEVITGIGVELLWIAALGVVSILELKRRR